MFLRYDNFHQGTKKIVFNIPRLIYNFFNEFLLQLHKSVFEKCISLHLDSMRKNSLQRFAQIRG